MQMHDATMMCVLPQLRQASKQIFVWQNIEQVFYTCFSQKKNMCFGDFMISSACIFRIVG